MSELEQLRGFVAQSIARKENIAASVITPSYVSSLASVLAIVGAEKSILAEIDRMIAEREQKEAGE